MTGKDERKEEVISGPGFILKEKPESENKKKEDDKDVMKYNWAYKYGNGRSYFWKKKI